MLKTAVKLGVEKNVIMERRHCFFIQLSISALIAVYKRHVIFVIHHLVLQDKIKEWKFLGNIIFERPKPQAIPIHHLGVDGAKIINPGSISMSSMIIDQLCIQQI